MLVSSRDVASLHVSPHGDLLAYIRYKHMYVTKRENGMHMRMGEFMPQFYRFVWGDRGGYAYNEYMLISGMLVTGVFCMSYA